MFAMWRSTLLALCCLLSIGHACDHLSFQLVLNYIDHLKVQVEMLKQKCGGTATPTYPRDCYDILESGRQTDGVYTVYLTKDRTPVPVYCDMTTDGGGWTVFQRRQDGSVDFYRRWDDYSAGFGDAAGEYWLGNDYLYWLTLGPDHKNYEMRIDMTDFNRTSVYAEYSNFKVASESLKYKLVSVGTYSGTAGDSLVGHVGASFSTFDQDNDSHGSSCAKAYKGAWWYKACHSSNLNGRYLSGPHTSYADGVNWKAFRGYNYSLKFTEMKIRPVKP